MNEFYFHTNNSILEPLKAPCLGRTENVFIKRDDLIHPIVSGNKWRKLEFTLADALEQGKNHIVTFGGAYSNHLVATACAGATLGLKTSCFIRGEELSNNANHYLFAAKLYGMNLIPVAREEYREKEMLFEKHFGNDEQAYYVAEGGESVKGYEGVAKVIEELPVVPDYILHASATATTAIGLGLGLRAASLAFNTTQILSVAILNNVEEQRSKCHQYQLEDRITICEGFGFGGYAKTTPELLRFCAEFIRQTGVMVDPVYTGKSLWALKSLIEKGSIPEEKKVVFLHTGGTLGIFSEKFISEIDNLME